MLKRFAASFVALLLPYLACLPVPGFANEMPAYPFIHVNGVASLHVVPDIGEIDFEFAASDANPQVAWDVVQARLTALHALLDEQGPDVATVDISEISRGSGARKVEHLVEGKMPTGIEVRVSIRLTVRKLMQWRAIVTSLVVMPNAENFSAVFSSSQNQKIETELVAQAIKDATRKAEDVAAGFGKRLGGVGAVSTGSLKNLTRAVGLASAETFREVKRARESENKDFSLIGLLKLVQSVDVIFKIK